MIYLDASVVFSLYCTDLNSALAVSLISASSEPLILSSLCEFEVINALSLCVFRKELSEKEALGARLRLGRNIDQGAYVVRPVSEDAFTRAKVLAEKLTPLVGVRAADLLHVSVALETGAKSFYTFDRKQHRAASTARLEVNQLPGAITAI